MSYDEKVQQLLEAAADYKAVTTSFNLESTLHAQVCKSAMDTVKQAIEKLSLGTIHLTVNDKNCLTVYVDELNITKASFYSIPQSFTKSDELTIGSLKSAVDRILVDALSFATSLRTCSI